MSYILEALKKSEQERTRGAAPTLHAIHAEPFFHKVRFSFWHYALVSAVLAASALVVWHRPAPVGNSDAKGSDLSPLAAVEAPPPQAARRVEPAAVARPPSVAAAREVPVPPPPKAARQHEKARETERTAVPAPASVPPSQDAGSPKPQEEVVARAPSKHDVVDISELPSSVQRSMPKLAISGYINNPDDPSGRMVGIGDKLVREGDEVAAGLRLEQIAGTGAVFSYKGYHFRVRLP